MIRERINFGMGKRPFPKAALGIMIHWVVLGPFSHPKIAANIGTPSRDIRYCHEGRSKRTRRDFLPLGLPPSPFSQTDLASGDSLKPSG